MATFVTLPDTDLDANSPVTESLMLALRDNPIAIAQGDASAPNIASEAFADNSLDGKKIIDGSLSQSKIKVSALGASGSDSVVSGGAAVFKTLSATGMMYFRIDYTGGGGVQCLVNGAWATMTDTSVLAGFIWSNGTNIRFFASSGTTNINYTKIA